MKKSTILMCLLCVLVTFLSGCGCSRREKVFSKPEYVKEVLLQKRNFDNIRDDFLDQIEAFDGTTESKTRLDRILDDAQTFINNLRDILGPKVPETSRGHYENMINVYQQYLNAFKQYKNAALLELGEERNQAIREAEKSLSEANTAMLNLKD